MKHTKRKITTLAAFALCLSLLAFGSVAYFTAEDTAHNVITTCGVDIDLQEWTKAEDGQLIPFPKEGIGDVLPGTEVTKIAEVKNTGSAAAYVRVKVETKVILDDGTEGDPTPVTLDFNTTDWEFKDGFYYYAKALLPGETTKPLFTSVAFAKTMPNIYQNCKAVVDVAAYATQVANNGGSALTAIGWPEEG